MLAGAVTHGSKWERGRDPHLASPHKPPRPFSYPPPDTREIGGWAPDGGGLWADWRCGDPLSLLQGLGAGLGVPSEAVLRSLAEYPIAQRRGGLKQDSQQPPGTLQSGPQDGVTPFTGQASLLKLTKLWTAENGAQITLSVAPRNRPRSVFVEWREKKGGDGSCPPPHPRLGEGPGHSGGRQEEALIWEATSPLRWVRTPEEDARLLGEYPP